MKVGQRLFLAVLPAVLGVLLVAALAYWGQYAHRAPTAVVVAASVASVISLVMAWTNTRYVARRLERLTSTGARATSRVGVVREALSGALRGREAPAARPDEIDTIENVVDHLSGAVADAEADRAKQEATLDAQRRSYAELLASATAVVERRLEEIRLPLHILLENRFGDLNENQEEMLGAARAAADDVGAELSRLRAIADLDRGVVTLRSDRVHVADVLRSVLPILSADGDRRGVRVQMEIAPALPAIRADRRVLQEALELLLRDCVQRTPVEKELRIDAEADQSSIVIRAKHGGPPPRAQDVALAERLIAAQGGELSEREGETVVMLPT